MKGQNEEKYKWRIIDIIVIVGNKYWKRDVVDMIPIGRFDKDGYIKWVYIIIII